MIRATSLAAYADTATARATQESAVYQYIADNPAITRREIAAALGIETASVSARVNALIKAGQIVESGQRKDSITGKKAYILAVPCIMTKIRNAESCTQ